MIRRIAPSKDDMATLPVFDALPLSHVHVPATTDAFRAASDAIRAAGTVGFDTESKPLFDVGAVSDGPHIAQFATSTDAFIFQVHRRDGLPFLVDLLQSDAVQKVGFGLRSDLQFIRAKFGVELRAVVDLNDVFRAAGFRSSTGVRAAVAILFGRRFVKSKRQTTSNWALPMLDERQLAYAANDAWAALRVHQALPAWIERADREDAAARAAARVATPTT